MCNGVGISYEEKSRIFERFYKGEMSRKKSGNGLGLSILKKIVEQARGKISIESELDNDIVILPK
ncbi:MAG TPA: sensor histidine kinase [Neobacillus sp.]